MYCRLSNNDIVVLSCNAGTSTRRAYLTDLIRKEPCAKSRFSEAMADVDKIRLILKWDHILKLATFCHPSSMLAQGKSAGLITRRSLDRNQDMLPLLSFFFFIFTATSDLIRSISASQISSTGCSTLLVSWESFLLQLRITWVARFQLRRLLWITWGGGRWGVRRSDDAFQPRNDFIFEMVLDIDNLSMNGIYAPAT